MRLIVCCCVCARLAYACLCVMLRPCVRKVVVMERTFFVDSHVPNGTGGVTNEKAVP